MGSNTSNGVGYFFMSSKVSSRNTIYKEGKKGFLAEIVLYMGLNNISWQMCVLRERH